MHSVLSLAAIAAVLPQALAAYQGFNYGSTFTDGSAKAQSDFENDFKTAAGLDGTNGAFTSARLYTMIQGGTTNDVISAIPAAISTKTSLLLGLWASGGDANFANELAALKTAISQYGDSLGPLVAGISVGSEDLYRITPTGIENDSGVGAGPDVLTNYISQVRAAIANTALSGASIGHVDTWTAWVNGSNTAVIDAIDWLGVDAYPYFQNTMPNGIAQGAGLLDDAVSETNSVAQGKPIWITETGWPVSGDQENEAVASTENAKTFWDEAGCPRFGSVNIWWYTLQDSAPTTPNPSFGVIGSTLTTTPLYDLSCSGSTSNTSTTTTAASSSAAQPSTAVLERSSSSAVVVPPPASSSAGGVIVGGGGAGAGSSSAAAPTTTLATTTPVNTVVAPTTTVGSGSGAGNGTSSGSGSGAGNGTSPTTGGSGVTTTGSGSGSSTSGAVVVTNAGVALSGSIGAGFAALMAAILAL
ncbi:hypothetical protein Sste5346_006612 [Sporothrix stenoceras]|uniref:Probable glucan endo-1,3-beta-glucosidase eglC n=1 Tax=Sporothrix stenoceras TaxID=5173 RepID=A0ABR3YYM3_9PEZI